MTVQDIVHGAWARRAVRVDGSARFETQHVVWIQAGRCYADIRVAFHPGGATRWFGGRSGWAGGDRYQWQRRLDSEPFVGEDVGELTWGDGVLMERGLFEGVPYEEEWLRLPGSDGEFVALEAPDGCLVRTGDHAIVVTTAAAAYRVRRDGSWHTELSAGSAALPDPDELPPWLVIHRGVQPSGAMA